MKSKTESPSARIKRMIKVLSVYSFEPLLYERKDMTLNDVLSKLKVAKSNPHENLPISCGLQEVIQEKYHIYASFVV